MSPLEGVFRPEEINSLISITAVAKQTPYSVEFVRLLARQNKIRAVKVGRNWLTTTDAVLAYIQAQQRRHEHKLQKLNAAERSLQ